MDREDKRRYLVVGSVILEIVSPLLRKKLEDYYKSKGFGCLQDFVNSLPIKHILFHLRHKHSQCCIDEANCFNLGLLPLNYSQWKRLYAEDHGRRGHHCHCKYTAKPIFLNDLDITLASLILLNCFSLTPNENTLISDLREFKNNYLSHNTDGHISETEYNTLWKDLTSYVQQLDPSKEDELVIIQNRPLDESLCEKYVTCLLDVHVILQKIDSKIDATSADIKTTIGNGNTEVMETIGTKTAELLAINNVVLMAEIKEVLQNMICQRRKETLTNKIDTKIDATSAEIRTTIGNSNTEVMETIGTKTAELLTSMGINNAVLMSKIEEVLQNMICQRCKRNINEQDKHGRALQPYNLGHSIFKLHHEIDLTSAVGDNWKGVSDIVIMDDGRLVMCLPRQKRLLICNTDGSLVDSIHVQNAPFCVIAVNNSTVAVILKRNMCIEMYDINNKLKLKSIPVPEMGWGHSITTISNKLVVGGYKRLLIIDHQAGAVVQTIHTDCHPGRLHGSGDRIYYCDRYNYKLYWYIYTDDRHHTLALPSTPLKITTLQDGSLYVMCEDGLIQHVSSDGKQYKTVTTKELEELKYYWISYLLNQRKLVTLGDQMTIKVFHEN